MDHLVIVDPGREEHSLEGRSGPVRDPPIICHCEEHLGPFAQGRGMSRGNVDATTPPFKVFGAQPARTDPSRPGVLKGERPASEAHWKVPTCAHGESLLESAAAGSELSTGTRGR